MITGDDQGREPLEGAATARVRARRSAHGPARYRATGCPQTIHVWGPPRLGRRRPCGLSIVRVRARRSWMSMVCGLDLHRQQITFDALEVESGDAWRGRLWQ